MLFRSIAVQATLNIKNDTAGGVIIENRSFQGLIDIIDDATLCLECVETLTVMIHGDVNYSLIEQPRGKGNSNTNNTQSNYITISNVDALFSKLNSEESFCSDCVIYWISCFTGIGPIPQAIANITGCKVYAPNGLAETGSEHDPLNSDVSTDGKNYLPNGIGPKKSFSEFNITSNK